MISRLLKLSLFSCIVFAASVPAEAGILDRILNRSGGRRAGCCQPQASCAPASCAPAPCAPAPCAPAPCAPAACPNRSCATAPNGSCQSTPTCLSQYRDNLVLLNGICGTDRQLCAEYQRRAAQAYCECIKETGTPTCSGGSQATMLPTVVINCVHPAEPSLNSCDAFYNECMAAGTNPSCARCWIACVIMSQSNPIVPSP